MQEVASTGSATVETTAAAETTEVTENYRGRKTTVTIERVVNSVTTANAGH